MPGEPGSRSIIGAGPDFPEASIRQLDVPVFAVLSSISPMKRLFFFWLTVSLLFVSRGAPVRLFDGVSFSGWEGETNSVWRIRDGAIVGGSLAGNARNEFLATTVHHRNFRLKLEYRLIGTEGFVNGGVQFRSRRVLQPPNEVSGYQADIGAGFSGCLYDESRRNRTLAMADTRLVAQLEKPGDWNRYEIEAVGRQVVLTLNGQRTAVWVERDPGIERDGIIALQIHGGSKAEIAYRNLELEELPESEVPLEEEVLGRFGEGQPAAPWAPFEGRKFALRPDDVVAMIGQENFVRDQKAGELESVLAPAFADLHARFRPMAWEADTVYEQWRDLHFGAWTPQLERAGATVVMVQYGQMEALDGPLRLPEFIAAYHRLLDQFAARTRRLVIISPMPFERPLAPDAPDLTLRNADLAAYVSAIRELSAQRGAVFVDLFEPFSHRSLGSARWTDDGIHLHPEGLREAAREIARQLGVVVSGNGPSPGVRQAVVEKNRIWYDCWRPANWSFAYGDRISQAYGKGVEGQPSLQGTLEQHRVELDAADARIQAAIHGDIQGAKSPVPASPPPSEGAALSPEEEAATFTVADGYSIQLFASERDGVAKPTQIAWDERGRLYVACSPTYPQTRASVPPSDYILRLEDANRDGRADRAVRYAEGLTMVQGLEPGDGGLYVCDFDQIVHLEDTDGDGRADRRRVLLSGFGVGDTHQLVNSICHGPDGSLWFTQGLHAFSRVETPWGIARLDRAGVWRLRPRTLRMDGFFGGGMAGANCWGVAFDDYGQVFHKSGDRPQGYWTVPGMVRGADPLGSGSAISADVSYANSPEQYHSVGPLFDTEIKSTSLDIVGTQGMPENIQGCAVIGGYFGAVVELHRFSDSGSGFTTTQLPKLVRSSSTSFRPVDVSVGPDGAIYIADWFNPIIGHYQASYADPRRDKTHGRIWRVTANGRPPVRIPDLASMNPDALLEQLRSPERWVRSQARRLLFDGVRPEVLTAADRWVAGLNPSAPEYERWLLEVTGVFEAHESPRPKLLNQLLSAKDFRVRAYGARVIGAWADQLPDALERLDRMARDVHPRVRLEAVVAASYFRRPEAISAVTRALESPRDPFLDYAIRQSARALQSQWSAPFASGALRLDGDPARPDYLRALMKDSRVAASPGQAVYEMACLPCHQPEGKGLPGVYPPLAGSEWVQGDPTRLVRILLHGLKGQVQVDGHLFGGGDAVPMPSMAGLEDGQIAAVLSYIRQSFGNHAPKVTADAVDRIRKATSGRTEPWTAEELLAAPTAK